VLRFRARPTAETTHTPASDSAGDVDDAVLVAAARINPESFTALYQRYLDRIYRYCYLRLGSQAAAEDATSDIFLKALTGLATFRGGNFAAWIFRIAHNVVVDAQRKGVSTVGIDTAGDLRDPADLPEELAITGAERAALQAAVRSLPDDQRSAVELQLAGWSSEQIAAALGKSPGAVRMLRVRALDQLQALLAPPPPEPSGGRHADA
jgi:RNA polymerase sigma-70 factor, ECF subfamily